MRKVLALLLCVLLAFSIVGCASQTTEKAEESAQVGETGTPTYTAGTYTATATGRNGPVTVSVTVSDDAIESVDVTDNIETAYIGDIAVERLPAAIVEGQTLDVDNVSGATFTCFAIKTAVKDALTQAGADIAYLESNGVEPVSGQTNDLTASVVVVGAGGAGFAAAVSALESGAESVIIMEKTDIIGGDTMVNGGIYNCPDEALQSKTEMTDAQKALVEAALAEEPVSDEHAALQAELQADYDAYLASGSTGIFDSVAWFALQTWNGGDKVANLDLVYTLASNSLEDYHWLESLGAEFKDSISQGPGSLYPRTHDTITGIGSAFINTYASYIEAHYADKCTILFSTPGEALIMEDGVCVGVTGTDKNDNVYNVYATGGVVLATGGFAGNVEMRVEYCQGEKWPDLGSSLMCTGVASDTGDGIIMAQEVGANVVDMDQLQLLHMCSPFTGSATDNSAKCKSVTDIIFVNQEGNRFTAEDGRRDTICLDAIANGGLFYTIESWDGNAEDATLDNMYTNNLVSYADEIARGYMFYGETLEDLAAEIGADADNLIAAVENYNQCVEDGVATDEFGRTTFVNKLETGPWLAVSRKPAIHHTMGGLEINENAEVIGTDGNVIPGLFAAGEVTGGIHGGNRLGGNAIVDTVVFGRIAGASAAAE